MIHAYLIFTFFINSKYTLSVCNAVVNFLFVKSKNVHLQRHNYPCDFIDLQQYYSYSVFEMMDITRVTCRILDIL